MGSIVWDAEIILAHYLDQAYGSRLSGMRVLELGAGTGLAGIVRASRWIDLLRRVPHKIYIYSHEKSSEGHFCRASRVCHTAVRERNVPLRPFHSNMKQKI